MSYEILTALYILIAALVYCMMELSERGDETNATTMFLLAGALWPIVTLIVFIVFVPSQVHGYVLNKRLNRKLQKQVVDSLAEVYRVMREEEYLELDIATRLLIQSAISESMERDGEDEK